jgi:hypothetical protein
LFPPRLNHPHFQAGYGLAGFQDVSLMNEDLFHPPRPCGDYLKGRRFDVALSARDIWSATEKPQTCPAAQRHDCYR